MKINFFLIIIFFSISVNGFSQVNYVWTHSPDDLTENDLFGTSVSMSNDFMFVGASMADDAYLGEDVGVVYVYKNNGTDWSQHQKLQPWYQTNDVYFGNAVSMFGNYAIVGAYYDSYNEQYEGSAYIYYLNEGTDEWFAVSILLPEGDTEADLFGYEVSITEEYAAVCALFDDASGAITGAVYVFGKDEGGQDNWGLIKKIVPASTFTGLNFGHSLAFQNDTLYVGAPGDNTNGDYSGACYVFFKDQGGINNWGEIDVLFAEDASYEDNFGSEIYINQNFLAIGAPNAGDTSPGEGAVYLFEKNEGNWLPSQKISSSISQLGSKFGISVAYSQNMLFVGAPETDNIYENDGQVYVFEQNLGIWNQTLTLNNPNSGINDYFGNAVSVNNNSVFVGTPQNTEVSVTGATGAILEYEIVPSNIYTIGNNKIKIQIFPNPTSSYIQVQSLNSDIQNIVLMDLSGKVLQNISNPLSLQTLSLTNYSTGIYMLKIKTQNSIIVEKIIRY